MRTYARTHIVKRGDHDILGAINCVYACIYIRMDVGKKLFTAFTGGILSALL